MGLRAGLAGHSSTDGKNGAVGEEHSVHMHAFVVQRAFCMVSRVGRAEIDSSDSMGGRQANGAVVFRAATEDHKLLILRWGQNHACALVAVALSGQSVDDDGGSCV